MSGRHSTRAARALIRLAEDDPAFAALSLWCRHRDDDTPGLLADTDGTTIRYGLRFDGLPLAEQIGIAAHQILHSALRHPARADSFAARFGAAHDPESYNIAADAVVNECLIQAGFVLPRPFVTLKGVLDEGLGDTGPDPNLADWDADRLYVRLMARKSNGGDGGKLKSYAATRGFDGDLRPAIAEEHGGDEVAADWQQRLSRALEAGRAAGRGIGMLGAALADIPQSRTPWEVVLRGLLARAVTQTPRLTHARPARQWLALDSAAGADETPAFQPGVARAQMVPRIAVCIDVSTSIDAPRRALFAAQVAGVGKRTGVEVHVLVFDEVVHRITRMTGANWDREVTDIALADGGGTSFLPVLEAATVLAPSAIVVLTDLDGPVGPAPPCPVIWAVPQDPAPTPPFGRVLSLAR